jgi:hypothetical protein
VIWRILLAAVLAGSGGACATLPLVQPVESTLADHAADYMTALCAVSAEDRAEVVRELNAVIEPNSFTVWCADATGVRK